MLKMVIVWVLAALLLLWALLVTLRSKWNVGTLLMWLAGGGLFLYGLFYPEVDRFTASGLGFVLKVCVLAGAALLLGLVVFLGVRGGVRDATGRERAIIVLGAGLRRRALSDLLCRRMVAARAAFLENPGALVVVSGGQGRGEEVSEAAAMRAWLLQNGVPEGNIIAEDRSTSTETNLLFSKELLARRGVGAEGPVLLVTNSFHCYRARCFAKKIGFLDVHCLPASMNFVTWLQNYLREAVAVVYMWLVG